jgi:hypothetical protein
VQSTIFDPCYQKVTLVAKLVRLENPMLIQWHSICWHDNDFLGIEHTHTLCHGQRLSVVKISRSFKSWLLIKNWTDYIFYLFIFYINKIKYDYLGCWFYIRQLKRVIIWCSYCVKFKFLYHSVIISIYLFWVKKTIFFSK